MNGLGVEIERRNKGTKRGRKREILRERGGRRDINRERERGGGEKERERE